MVWRACMQSVGNDIRLHIPHAYTVTQTPCSGIILVVTLSHTHPPPPSTHHQVTNLSTLLHVHVASLRQEVIVVVITAVLCILDQSENGYLILKLIEACWSPPSFLWST